MKSTKSLLLAAITLLCSLTANAEAIPSRSICVPTGTVNVRNDSLTDVVFEARLGDIVEVGPTPKEKQALLGGKSYTFLFVTFPNVKKSGWVVEAFVTKTAQCPYLGGNPAEPKVNAPDASGPKTKVIYFGGYLASASQMACWKAGATKNAPSNYAFEAIAWPSGAGAGFASAVSAGNSQIKQVVNEINTHPDTHYIIVGHSSGAALSDTVAGQIQNSAQIQLVSLDGFAPSPALQKRLNGAHADRPGALCVSAHHGGMESRNASSMQACANHRQYADNHCQSVWCLHFSLVDKATPSSLGSNFPRDGYDGCDTNVDWLSSLTRN
jgi:hypothetical protein